jgi:integrase
MVRTSPRMSSIGTRRCFLTSGVHPKVAQERLGHSSVGITLDLYSHVLPGMQEDAAAKVDAAIRAAIDEK